MFLWQKSARSLDHFQFKPCQIRIRGPASFSANWTWPTSKSPLSHGASTSAIALGQVTSWGVNACHTSWSKSLVMLQLSNRMWGQRGNQTPMASTLWRRCARPLNARNYWVSGYPQLLDGSNHPQTNSWSSRSLAPSNALALSFKINGQHFNLFEKQSCKVIAPVPQAPKAGIALWQLPLALRGCWIALCICLAWMTAGILLARSWWHLTSIIWQQHLAFIIWQLLWCLVISCLWIFAAC